MFFVLFWVFFFGGGGGGGGAGVVAVIAVLGDFLFIILVFLIAGIFSLRNNISGNIANKRTGLMSYYLLRFFNLYLTVFIY